MTHPLIPARLRKAHICAAIHREYGITIPEETQRRLTVDQLLRILAVLVESEG